MQALGFNLLSFIINLVLFPVLFVVLNKFLVPPLLKNINARKKLLEDNLKLQAEIELHKEKLEKEAKQKEAKLIEKAELQAEEIISQANTEAKSIVETAKEKSKTMLDEVKELIAKKQKSA